MKKVILGTLVGVVVTTALVWFLSGKDEVEEVTLVTSQAEVINSPATFAWRFSPSETTNLDGQPKTNIFLTIARGDEKIERLIDTVDGGCSELAGEKYEGDISDTGRVQCYGAGLGQQYRITQGEQVYLIERKYFEEALPDIVPLRYEWEVIGDLSFK